MMLSSAFKIRRILPRIVVICVLATPASYGQDDTAAISQTVAARVNGREVTVADVEHQIRLAVGDREVDPAALPKLRYETLRKLVDRELVLLLLEERKLAATTDDVDLAVDRLTEALKARGRTLDDYLANGSLTQEQLKRSLRWTISWKRMLDEYMTEENLERYFEGHRRHFDGTQLRVAHILLKADANPDTTIEQAKKIREEIESGSLSFSDAARKYSQAPTAQQGGDIGWIERHAPMPEPFSAAAFDLELNQISQPVMSSFGVHLIQCLEIKAGDRQWRDVRRELESAVSQYLFNWAADRQRKMAQIEWLDAIPAPDAR